MYRFKSIDHPIWAVASMRLHSKWRGINFVRNEHMHHLSYAQLPITFTIFYQANLRIFVFFIIRVSWIAKLEPCKIIGQFLLVFCSTFCYWRVLMHVEWKICRLCLLCKANKIWLNHIGSKEKIKFVNPVVRSFKKKYSQKSKSASPWCNWITSKPSHVFKFLSTYKRMWMCQLEIKWSSHMSRNLGAPSLWKVRNRISPNEASLFECNKHVCSLITLWFTIKQM